MSRTEEVIALVRELDGLEAERRRLTSVLDGRIADLRSRIAGIVEGDTVRQTKGRKSEVTDRLVDAIRHDPSASIEVLSAALYGDDSPEARHRTRAQVHRLKVKGVLSGSPGAWALDGAKGHAE